MVDVNHIIQQVYRPECFRYRSRYKEQDMYVSVVYIDNVPRSVMIIIFYTEAVIVISTNELPESSIWLMGVARIDEISRVWQEDIKLINYS